MIRQDVSAATRDRLDLKRGEVSHNPAVVWTHGCRWKRCSPKRAKPNRNAYKTRKKQGNVLFCCEQPFWKRWKQTSLRKQLNSEFVVFACFCSTGLSPRKCLYDFNRWMSISMPHLGGWFGRAVLKVLVPTDIWGCFFSKLFAWRPKTYSLTWYYVLWGIIAKNMPAACVKRRQLQYKSYKTGIKSEVHLFGRIKL